MIETKPAPTPRRIFLHLLLCVTIARSTALGSVWCNHGRRQRHALVYVEALLDVERLEAHIRILLGWLARSKCKKRYAAREWQFILEFGARWERTNAQLARDVGVSAATISRRRRRWCALGRAVPQPPKPKTPCTRIADNRRALVHDMTLAGYKSNLTVSRHLELQGEKVSARSVGRIRVEPAAPRAVSRSDDPPRGKVQKTSEPTLKEPPDLAAHASAYVVGSEQLARPRAARLIRALADAFAQGIALDNLWLLDAEDSDAAFAARLKQSRLRRTRLSEQLEILEYYLSHIPPANRHRFLATERAAIFAFKYCYRLSNKTTADWFFVNENTLSNWGRDVDGLGSREPRLVQTLPNAEAAIAEVLAMIPRVPNRLKPNIREAIAALAENVPVRKRKNQEARIGMPTNERGTDTTRPGSSKRKRAPIEARHRNHYWSSDLTVIRLGHEYYLAAVVDLFSRDIVAWDLFATQPESEQIATLFNDAVARCGKPEHFVTDHGGQFLGTALQALITSFDVEHRKGAIGQHGSIAVTERFWRTAKDFLDLKAVRPNVPAILKYRVAVVIDYYRTKRPHSKLGNATPAEVYQGIRSRALDAKPAPRGWFGEPCPPPPFRIRHAFEDDRKLPYLERIA